MEKADVCVHGAAGLECHENETPQSQRTHKDFADALDHDEVGLVRHEREIHRFQRARTQSEPEVVEVVLELRR